jgi:hypothetical protein
LPSFRSSSCVWVRCQSRTQACIYNNRHDLWQRGNINTWHWWFQDAYQHQDLRGKGRHNPTTTYPLLDMAVGNFISKVNALIPDRIEAPYIYPISVDTNCNELICMFNHLNRTQTCVRINCRQPLCPDRIPKGWWMRVPLATDTCRKRPSSPILSRPRIWTREHHSKLERTQSM